MDEKLCESQVCEETQLRDNNVLQQTLGEKGKSSYPCEICGKVFAVKKKSQFSINYFIQRRSNTTVIFAVKHSFVIYQIIFVFTQVRNHTHAISAVRHSLKLVI